MHEFELALAFDGEDDEFLDEIAEAAHEAGCDDATFSVRSGTPYAAFTRDGDTFADAALSAIATLEALPGVEVRRIDSAELVTAAEIARRTGRTRQSVQQLASGTRGDGDFPRPLRNVRGARVWEWAAVSSWFERRRLSSQPRDGGTDDFIAAVNGALAIRHHLPQVSRPEEREAISALAGSR